MRKKKNNLTLEDYKQEFSYKDHKNYINTICFDKLQKNIINNNCFV